MVRHTPPVQALADDCATVRVGHVQRVGARGVQEAEMLREGQRDVVEALGQRHVPDSAAGWVLIQQNEAKHGTQPKSTSPLIWATIDMHFHGRR